MERERKSVRVRVSRRRERRREWRRVRESESQRVREGDRRQGRHRGKVFWHSLVLWSSPVPSCSVQTAAVCVFEVDKCWSHDVR